MEEIWSQISVSSLKAHFDKRPGIRLGVPVIKKILDVKRYSSRRSMKTVCISCDYQLSHNCPCSSYGAGWSCQSLIQKTEVSWRRANQFRSGPDDDPVLPIENGEIDLAEKVDNILPNIQSKPGLRWRAALVKDLFVQWLANRDRGGVPSPTSSQERRKQSICWLARMFWRRRVDGFIQETRPS